MTISSIVSHTPVTAESFWNLLQTADEDTQKAVYHILADKYAEKTRSRAVLTDEQLSAELSAFAPITEDSFPELTRSQYVAYAKSRSGKIQKGVEKWL